MKNITNKLYLVNPLSKKKLCISVCLTNQWYICNDIRKKYEDFFREGERLNPAPQKNHYTLDYEHPFWNTPKSYQENYLRRKFGQKEITSPLYQTISNGNTLKKEEFSMDFKQAVEATKSGARVTRPDWDSNMYMWWEGSYCVHTHPYFDYQTKAPSLAGYLYVSEKDDATCEDWSVVGA